MSTDRLTGPGIASAPRRAAAIDVGSNAIRFLAAERDGTGRLSILDAARASVRMGGDAFRTGSLAPEAMDRGVEALQDFRERMDALSIRDYRAVATSAVRDSDNASEFVARAWKRCRIRLETITGVEELRLVWVAVTDRVDLGGGRWLLVDLGGGSLEVSLIDSVRIHETSSEPLGTVRLLEEAGLPAVGSPDELRGALRAMPAVTRIATASRAFAAVGVIATGGNIEVLAQLAEAPADEKGVRRLPLDVVRRLLHEMAHLPAAERMRRFGLRGDRADVIVPAALVYEAVAEMVDAEEILVPGVGVREGILLDLIRSLPEQGSG